MKTPRSMNWARCMACGALLTVMAGSGSARGQNTAPPLSSRISPKAQQLLDRSIQALGGQAFLGWKNLVTSGRVYAIEDGQTASLAPFKSTEVPPDKRRLSYGKDKPVTLINAGEDAWEIDQFGVIRQSAKQARAWRIANRYSLENLLRLRIRETGVLILDDGMDFVENRPADVLEIIDPEQVHVKLYLDQKGFLPVQISYIVENPQTHDRDEYTDAYSDYRLFQGIETPMHITRYVNGDRVAETFRNTVRYDEPVPAGFFEPPQ